jgi:two-component system nitrate/nitrite response regulator NarL
MDKTILIVDDNKLLRSTIRALVENEGLVVCGEAADGVEAIQKAKELKPSLVLLDLAMPKLNGAAAASVIKRTLPETLVVLFTLHDDAAEVLAPAANIDVVLPKSYGLNHLVRRVQDIFDSVGG